MEGLGRGSGGMMLRCRKNVFSGAVYRRTLMRLGIAAPGWCGEPAKTVVPSEGGADLGGLPAYVALRPLSSEGGVQVSGGILARIHDRLCAGLNLFSTS